MATIEDFTKNAHTIDISSGTEYFLSAMVGMAEYGRQLPPWWSAQRDKKIRQLWREDSMMIPSFLFAAQSKVANMPIQVIARDQNIRSHVALATELNEQFHALSEFGEGLLSTMLRFSEDYFGQDNGGFIEIVAEGSKQEPIVGVPLGIRHLDAAFCVRQSDPLYPVAYHHSNGKRELYHHTRIMRMSQMPSAQRDMLGVGYCAISRSIEIAKRYNDMTMYIRGKMGGARAKRLLVGTNIGGREMIKAMAAAGALRDVIGDLDTDTIAIGGPDLDVKTVDLYHYMELDEEKAMVAMMAMVAMAWGMEFQEVYPIMSGRSNAEVSQRIGRAKMPATFIAQLQHNLSAKLVPSFLMVKVNYDDDSQQQQEAIVADIQARVLERMASAGVMGNISARRTLRATDYITETDFIDLCLADGTLPDGTPVVRAFFDSDYEQVLTVDREFLLGTADKEAVRRAVFDNEAAIYSLYGKTTANALHVRYKIALAALSKLKDMYLLNSLISLEENTQEVTQEDPEEENVREEESTTAPRGMPEESIDSGGA